MAETPEKPAFLVEQFFLQRLQPAEQNLVRLCDRTHFDGRTNCLTLNCSTDYLAKALICQSEHLLEPIANLEISLKIVAPSIQETLRAALTND